MNILDWSLAAGVIQVFKLDLFTPLMLQIDLIEINSQTVMQGPKLRKYGSGKGLFHKGNGQTYCTL